MKKRIAAIFAAILLGSSCLADYDLAGMSTSDLQALSCAVQSELWARSIVSGVTVYPGTYHIGSDIPAGTYSIDVVSGSGSIYYAAIVDEDAPLVAENIGDLFGVTHLGKIILSDGFDLVISNVVICFYPYTGIFN